MTFRERFVPSDPRGVGDELAAKLEQAMGKPNGWMDESHQEFMEERARYNAEPGPELRSLHPLISWVQAGGWTEIAGGFALGDAEDLRIDEALVMGIDRARQARVHRRRHKGEELVFPCRDADSPAWSPDGTRIAFERIDNVRR